MKRLALCSVLLCSLPVLGACGTASSDLRWASAASETVPIGDRSYQVQSVAAGNGEFDLRIVRAADVVFGADPAIEREYGLAVAQTMPAKLCPSTNGQVVSSTQDHLILHARVRCSG